MKNNEEKKSPWKSKTMWVNLTAIIGFVAAGMSDKLDAATPEQITFGFVVMGLINLGLRDITKHPIGIGK